MLCTLLLFLLKNTHYKNHNFNLMLNINILINQKKLINGNKFLNYLKIRFNNSEIAAKLFYLSIPTLILSFL